jgi:hypothetical protein
MPKKKPGASTAWADNDVQFPRLLAELRAAIAPDTDIIAEVAASMDLTTAEVHTLFIRAEKRWEEIKEELALDKVNWDVQLCYILRHEGWHSEDVVVQAKTAEHAAEVALDAAWGKVDTSSVVEIAVLHVSAEDEAEGDGINRED